MMLSKRLAFFVLVAGVLVLIAQRHPAASISICTVSGNPVFADNTGASGAAAAIQSCLDSGDLSGGVWEIPSGVYQIDAPLDVNRSMTWRTVGTAGTTVCPYNDNGATCALLLAAPNLTQTLQNMLPTRHPMLQVNQSAVAMDHLIVDGNRVARLADGCPDGYIGANMWFTPAAVSSTFTNNVTRNAVCGSGMASDGDSMTIQSNYFYHNGDHGNGRDTLRWADGLTLTHCSGCYINNNNLTDNTDVQLVFGNGTNSTVSGNTIQQLTQSSFAGLALDDFNNASAGNFAGTVVSGNNISCGSDGSSCDIAVNVGPHAWYNPGNIKGGAFTGNTVAGGRVGVLVEGAGTATEPTTVSGNTVTRGSGVPACGQTVTMLCQLPEDPVATFRTLHTCNWVYNDQNFGHTGDSFVNTNGENGALYPGSENWHGCKTH